MKIRYNKKARIRIATRAFSATLLCAISSVNAETSSTGSPVGDAILEEVLVTAQRREEHLKDVPISITALTAESLDSAGISTSRDLAMVTPGLRIEATGTYLQPTIRGISTTLTTTANESSVATYIDGVYQQSLIGAFYSLPDVKQIEVLKGPQGTLFGRNATAGAILISTYNPDLNNANGKMSGSYGSFNSATLEAFASVPIIPDRLAASLTGYYDASDGYKHNLLKNGKRDGAHSREVLFRGKVRFVPWDGADFVLSALYDNRNDDGSLKGTNLNGNNASRYLLLPGQPLATRPNDFASDINPFVDTRTNSQSLRGTIEVGPGSLTTTTAHIRSNSKLLTDSDNSPRLSTTLGVDGYSEVTTQEFVYATTQLGNFRAVAGLFYYRMNAGQLPLDVLSVVTGAPVVRVWMKDKDDAYSAFSEGTYDFAERLSLTLGLRWNREKRSSYSTPPPGTAGSVVLTEPSSIPQIGTAKTWVSITPRASLLYRITDYTNVYFTYSEGFKGGTFNTSSAQVDPVNPETVKSYELGIKSELRRGLSLSGATFYYDYADLQVASIANDPVTGALIQSLRNAAQAKIYGAELNIAWNAIDHLNLSLGGTYLHARYGSFPTAVVSIPNANGAGNSAAGRDVSGNTMIRSPEWSGNLTASYDWDTQVGNFELSGTLFHSSKVYYDISNRIAQNAYADLNASLTWRPNDSNFKAKLWGRNLTDRTIIQSTTISNSYDQIYYAAPRALGIELAYSFK